MIDEHRVDVLERPVSPALQPVVNKRAVAVSRISWGAIIAGATVAIANQLAWAMLGLGIGMSTINPATSGTPSGSAIGIGAAIWWIVTGLVSLFLGGLVAGRMAGLPRPRDGMLHGLLVWSLTAVIGLYLVSTGAANLLGGTLGTISDALGTAARSASNADLAVDPDAVRSTFADATQAVREELPGGTGGEDGRPAVTEPEARRAAEQTAETVSSAALWSFFALALGATAAGIGGSVGTPRRALVADGTEVEPSYGGRLGKDDRPH